MSWQLLAKLDLYTEDRSFNVVCYCTRAFMCPYVSEHDENGIMWTESIYDGTENQKHITNADNTDSNCGSYRHEDQEENISPCDPVSADFVFSTSTGTSNNSANELFKNNFRIVDNDPSTKNDILFSPSTEESLPPRGMSLTTSHSNDFTENTNDNISTIETFSTQDFDFSTNILSPSVTSKCSFGSNESVPVTDTASSFNINKSGARHTNTNTDTSLDEFVLVHSTHLQDRSSDIKASDIESSSSGEPALSTDVSSTQPTNTSDYASENDTSSKKSEDRNRKYSNSSSSSSDSFYSLHSSDISFSSVFDNTRCCHEHSEDDDLGLECFSGYHWFSDFTIDTAQLSEYESQDSIESKNKSDLYADSSSSSGERDLSHYPRVSHLPQNSHHFSINKRTNHDKCDSQNQPTLNLESGSTYDTESFDDNSLPDFTYKHANEHQHYENEEYDDTSALIESEAELMKAMGLPICFGKQTSGYSDNLKKKNKKQKTGSFRSSCQKIQAAFDLIQITFFSEAQSLGGQVHYKMKRIGEQNLKLNFGNKKRKYFYDDDDSVISQGSNEGKTSEDYQHQQNEACALVGKHTTEIIQDTDIGCRSTSSNAHKNVQRSNEGGSYNIALKPRQHIFFDDDGNPIPYVTRLQFDEKCQEKDYSGDNVSRDLLVPKSTESALTDNIYDGEVTGECSTSLPENPNTKSTPKNVTENLPKEMLTISKKLKKKTKRELIIDQIILQNPSLFKYWQKRFKLFSKFNDGIQLDEESWYSVTPETVAKYTAERCKCGVIVDGFCGAGGNAIQFAFTCERVIAIDIDPQKIKLARNNATVYGVQDKIDFVVGDFFQLAERLTADVVFLSPPWGGPSYLTNCEWYDLYTHLQPHPIDVLIDTARKVSHNVAIFLPRHSDVVPLLHAVPDGGRIELQQNIDHNKIVAITAFYNDLIKCDEM